MKERADKGVSPKVYKWNPNFRVYDPHDPTPHIIERMGWLNRQDCKYWKKKAEEEENK